MAAAGKPDKPYPEFPLFAHDRGQWAKKVRGKLWYFGVWADPDAALNKFLAERDALYAGRDPRAPATDGLTVGQLVNHFLHAKRQQRDAGELSPRMWEDYSAVGTAVLKAIDRTRAADTLTPDDFARVRSAAAARLGPTSLTIFLQRVRTIFKYGYEAGLLAVPVRFGPQFKAPPRRVARLAKASAGAKMLAPAEARRLIEAAGVPLRAMVLLGLNCGFGASDCASLPRAALDLAGGWVDFPRPKTGIARRCPLWPETVAAVRAALAVRPRPHDPADADLVFVTKYGRRWARFKGPTEDRPGVWLDAVQGEFRKIGGPGFYTLRRTFRTVADAALDPPAVDLIMGHLDATMGAVYRQRVADARLRKVTNAVRRWVWPKRKAAR